ncbi:hypothetical protein [Nocardia salmonicida]|nr:hypothetical protein [Nocardia salmonicida]
MAAAHHDSIHHARSRWVLTNGQIEQVGDAYPSLDAFWQWAVTAIR